MRCGFDILERLGKKSRSVRNTQNLLHESWRLTVKESFLCHNFPFFWGFQKVWLYSYRWRYKVRLAYFSALYASTFKVHMKYRFWSKTSSIRVMPETPITSYPILIFITHLRFFSRVKSSFTVFENHRKSLIQHCERSELRLQFEWTKVN